MKEKLTPLGRRITPSPTYSCTGQWKFLLLLFTIFLFSVQSSVALDPCTAELFDNGSTTDQIVPCGSAANTNNGLLVADQTGSTSFPMLDIADSCPAPLADQDVYWMTFEITEGSGTFEFQIVGGSDNLYYQLYYSDDGSCTGNLNFLTCGEDFSSWLVTPSPTPDPFNPTRYFIAIYNQDPALDATFLLKFRRACGEGCDEDDTRNIMVEAGEDECILRGESSTLTSSVSGGGTPYGYFWSPSDGLDNPNAANPIATPTETTTYTLTVTGTGMQAADRCPVSDTVTITVLDCNDNNCATDDEADLDACICVNTPNPPSCDDNDCTTIDGYDPDTCDCVYTDNTPVCDDMNCATDDTYDIDTCDCIFTPNPPVCNDDNCATADSYDPDTCDCVFTPDPPVCNDNNCATDDSYDPDTCDCVYTPNPPVCDDNDCATADSYDPDTCDCVFTPAPPHCDDNNCATIDGYDPDTCDCVHTDNPPVCDDLNCATDDTYDIATCECIYTPNPPVCNDDDCATIDSYDPDTCACVFTPDPPICDDNNCATDDSYDPDTCDCVYTDNPPVCDDNNCATDDSYDPDTCECVFTDNPPVCDDNNCATDDSYDPHTCECVFTANPPVCDDDDCATNDSYDPDTCECIFTPGPPVCDDNNCATTDTYDPATCDCVYTPNPPVCDDDNCATDDSYDPDTCACVFTDNPPVCDDDNCATDDSYDPHTCECVFTDNPPVCDDHNCATDDSYDPDTCECVYTANPPVCDDDDCATNDSYDPDTCECIFTPGPPVCDDNNCATTDTYDPATCDCVYTPNPPVCDDDNCATDDSYDPDTCACVFTDNPPVCDDDNCATDDSYDPHTCECVFTPNPPVCDDQDCATDDSYNPDTCECVFTYDPPHCDDDDCATNDSYDPDTCECIFTPGPPNCDDGQACTIDSYDEATCDCVNELIWLDFHIGHECTEDGVEIQIYSELAMGLYALQIIPEVPGLPEFVEINGSNNGVEFLTQIPNGQYQLIVTADVGEGCYQTVDFDVNCCEADAGSPLCSSHFCEGDHVTAASSGFNNHPDYQQYYIVASGSGEIVSWNVDGDFGSSLPAGEYCLVSLNWRNEGVQPAIGTSLSDVEALEGCWDLSECLTFEVLPQPSLNLSSNCMADGSVTFTIVGTGGSGTYNLTGPGIAGTETLTAGASYETGSLAADGTTYTYTITDILNNNCLATNSISAVCCAPEAGTVTCSDVLCVGDELEISHQDANDNAGYDYLYLVTDQDGKIVNISNTGSFFLDTGIYCVYGYNYQLGADPTLLPMLGQNVHALGDVCYDLTDDCYLVSVLSEPILSVVPVCSGNTLSYEVSATGGSGTYVITTNSGELAGYSIVATVGTTYSTSEVSADDTPYTFYIRDILDQDCTDQATVPATCCAAESGIPTLGIAPICAHDPFLITNDGYNGTAGYEQLYLIVSNIGLVVGTSNNENINIDLPGDYCIYALNYKLSDPPTIPGMFGSMNPLLDPDAEGCFDLSDCLNVTVNPRPGPPQVQGAEVCEGEDMSIMVINASPDFIYSWFASMTSTEVLATGVSYTPDAPGTYYVMATSSAGCNCVRTPVTLIVNDNPELTLTANNPCNEVVCDASITAQIDGGQAPFSFDWSGGGSGSVISDLCPGEYTLMVTDANGCTASASATITDNYCSCNFSNPVPVTDHLSVCFGAELPVLEVQDDGETYYWFNDPADSVPAETGLTYTISGPGTYYVQAINDTHGCASDLVPVVVTELPGPDVDLGEDLFLCAVNLPVVLTAGTDAAWTYDWSTGATTASIDVTTTGTYSVNVTDENGCTAHDEIHVTLYAAPHVDLGADISSCAAVELDAGSFYNPSYLWSTGETTQVINVATSGNYSVVVTDGNGCVGSDEIHVDVNALPEIDLGADIHVCADDLPVVLDAGAGFASYSWSDGSAAQTLTVSAAGAFSVIVVDDNGCFNSDVISVYVNDAPVADLGDDIVICADEGGASLSNLTMPAGASYLWSTGATSSSIHVSTSGTYTLTVTGQNGCSASDEIHVTINEPPTIILNGDVAACANAIPVFFGATALGNGPFEYLWSNTANTANTSTSLSGTYTVLVTDANGCTATSSINISINSNPEFDLGPDLTLCEDQLPFILAAPTVPGASYLWSNGATTQTIAVNAAGNYAVEITADDNCSGSDDVNITVSELPDVDLGSDIVLCAEDFPYTISAPAGFSYLWNTGATTQSIEATAVGTYEVAVTNAAGCTSSDDIFIGATVSTTPNCQEDMTVCEDQATIFASLPLGGSGTWSLTSGAGTITNPGSLTTGVTGLEAGDNVFTFTSSNAGCATASCSVTVHYNYLETPEAGPDQTVCGSSAQMNASVPSLGTGQWVTTSDATIADIFDPNSLITDIPSGSNRFSWVVIYNGCQVYDDVYITMNGVPGLPSGDTHYDVCLGDYPTMILNAENNEQVIEWFDNLSVLEANGAPIHVGMMYQPNLSLPGFYTYYARLRNSVSGCIGSEYITVTVNVGDCCGADAGTVAGSTEHCQGESGTATATLVPGSSSAPADYFYTFILTDSNSNTILQGPNASGQFNLSILSPGTYCIHGVSYSDQADINSSATTVTQLVAAGSCANISGCDAQINVSADPHTPSVGSQAICAGEAIPTFTVSNPQAGITYNWYDSAGGLLAFDQESFTPPAGGVFTVYATNGSNCTSSSTFSLTITGSPAAPTVYSVTACEGSTLPNLEVEDLGYMYYWYNEAGVLVGLNSTTFTPSVPGTYFVQAVAGGGCTSPQAQASVSLIPLPATPLVNSNEICSGQAIPAFTVQDQGYQYNWYDSSNVLVASNATSYTPSNAGTYYVSASNGACTSALATAILTIYSTPTAPETGSIAICQGEPTPAFQVTDLGYTYNWYNASNILVATGTSFVPSEPGTYYVGAVTGDCAGDLATVSYTEFPSPAAPTVYSQNVCVGDPFPALIVENATESYFWYDAQVGGNLIFEGLSFIPSAAGVYYVEARSTNGCASPRTSASLSVIPCTDPCNPDPGTISADTGVVCSNSPTISVSSTSSASADYGLNYFVVDQDGQLIFPFSDTGDFDFTGVEYGSYCIYAFSWKLSEVVNPIVNIIDLFTQDCCFALSNCYPVTYGATPTASIIAGPTCNEDGSFTVTVSATASGGSYVATLLDDGGTSSSMSNLSGGEVTLTGNGDGSNFSIVINDQSTNCSTTMDLGALSCQACNANAGMITSSSEYVCNAGLPSLTMSTTGSGNSYYYLILDASEAIVGITTNNLLDFSALAPGDYCIHGLAVGGAATLNTGATTVTALLENLDCFDLSACTSVQHVSTPVATVTTPSECNGDGTFTIGITVTGGVGTSSISGIASGITSGTEIFVTLAADGVTTYPIYAVDDITGCGSDAIGTYGPVACTSACPSELYLCTEPVTTITICPEFCMVEGIDDIQYGVLYTCSLNEGDSGCIEYTPLPGFFQTETMTITGCNTSTGECEVITAYIEVGGCNGNLPPVAVDDSYTTNVDTPITLEVVNNDSDPEGDPFMITEVTNGTNGTVAIAGDGTVIYTPNAGFVGTDTFTYTICTADGQCDTATVLIEIVYVCTELSYECTGPITPILICPSFCDLGPGAELQSVLTLYSCSISDLNEPEGCFTYTPLPGFIAEDLVTMTACDDNDNCQTVSMVIEASESCADNGGDTGDGGDDGVNPCDTSQSVCATTGVTNEYCVDECGIGPDASIVMVYTSTDATVTASGDKCVSYFTNGAPNGDIITVLIMDSFGFLETHYLYVTTDCGGDDDFVAEAEENQSAKTELNNKTLALNYLAPQPASDWLNVSFFNAAEGVADMQILDLQGRVVMDRKMEMTTGENLYDIDLSGMTAGMYILTIQNGHELISTRLVKE